MIANETKLYVLDTSAIMALIEDEAGADRVAMLIAEGNVLLPFVVALEVYYISLQEGRQSGAERRLFLLRQLPAKWLDTVDDRIVITAGRLKAQHRISFADSLIAAFALENNAVLVHKDPEYEVLASIPQEHLPYKR